MSSRYDHPNIGADALHSHRVGNFYYNKYLTGVAGVDLVTSEKVAIKLAKEGRDYSLENEFNNYMQLGADSELY